MPWRDRPVAGGRRSVFSIFPRIFRYRFSLAGPVIVKPDADAAARLQGCDRWEDFEPRGDYLLHKPIDAPPNEHHARPLALRSPGGRHHRASVRLIRRAVIARVRTGTWRIEIYAEESRADRTILTLLMWAGGAYATHFLALKLIQHWNIFRGHSLLAATIFVAVVLLLLLAVHLYVSAVRRSVRGRFAQVLIAEPDAIHLTDDRGAEQTILWQDIASIDARDRNTIHLHSGESFIPPPSFRLHCAMQELAVQHAIPIARRGPLTPSEIATRAMLLSLLPAALVYLALAYLPGQPGNAPSPVWSAAIFGAAGMLAVVFMAWSRSRPPI